MNVGSAAGILPIGDPLYSVYSGTKAYVDFFSKSLNLEYKSKGILTEVKFLSFLFKKKKRKKKIKRKIIKPKKKVNKYKYKKCHVPYFVTSKLSKIRKSSLLTPDPKTYAKAALTKIGHSASIVPYWAHALQHFLMTSLPEFVLSHLVLSHHLDIYKKAMKKAATEIKKE